jgi:AcrR family transcriptional regulator
MEYTRKVEHTRQQLKDSLLENMKNKSFTEITVNDIVDPIYLDRSTFYRYFDDKYELLANIEDSVLQNMEETRTKFPKGIPDSDEMLKAPAEYFRNNSAVLSILLGENGSPTFEIKLRNALNERFKELFNPKEKLHPELLMLSDLLINLVLHALKRWLLNPQELSLEKTLLLVHSAIEDGLYKAIKDNE